MSRCSPPYPKKGVLRTSKHMAAKTKSPNEIIRSLGTTGLVFCFWLRNKTAVFEKWAKKIQIKGKEVRALITMKLRQTAIEAWANIAPPRSEQTKEDTKKI